MSRKIFVTGVAGFIASRTAGMLLDVGDTVVGIDNLNDYYDVRVKRHRLEGLQGRPGFKFIEGDIEDKQLIDQIFEKNSFDAVLNLAARAGVRYSLENPRIYLTTNANGTLNLLEGCRHHEVPKFVLASTSSLYAGLPTPRLLFGRICRSIPRSHLTRPRRKPPRSWPIRITSSSAST